MREWDCLEWNKSSFSKSVDDCVEVAKLSDGGRAVRDSKNPTGEVLVFTASEWTAFTGGVRQGEFD